MANNDISIDDIVKVFRRNLEESEKTSYIYKPISHALYLTWLYFDKIENEQKGRL